MKYFGCKHIFLRERKTHVEIFRCLPSDIIATSFQICLLLKLDTLLTTMYM